MRELKLRHFKVPGLKIELSTSGTGYDKHQHVQTIDGEDCHIFFAVFKGK